MKIIPFLLTGGLLLSEALFAQYPAGDQIRQRLEHLSARKNADLAVLTKTAGGNEVYVITVGTGKTGDKPAVAVIGGVTGPARYSPELLLRMAEKMAKDDNPLLDEVTFYFFPDMSPDAAAHYFSSPAWERFENATPVDDDHDGKTDEDGYDDMNGDGMITWMRIRDTVTGTWITHPLCPSVMIKADPAKNEKGKYLLMHEGYDNDHDGKINEDGAGGVIFNKNFSFNYPGFSQGSGINSFSENETRGLAKFLFDHWNIYAILAIGPDNNLSTYNDLKVALIDKSVPSSVDSEDRPYFERMVRVYSERVKLPDASVKPPDGGDLLSWAYFHYNRFAFSTPAWNLPKADGDRGSAEYDALVSTHTADTVRWTEITHPDFPGKTVEIGGMKPFVTLDPPGSAMDSTADGHYRFLTDLARLHPGLEIRVKKVISRGDHIYQVEAEMVNSGGLPTMTHFAKDSKWVKKVRVDFDAGPGNQLAAGRKALLFDRIDPGEVKALNWIVNGRGPCDHFRRFAPDRLS